ncbi:hypothetical protein AACH06_12115 [Ideonella sp. DXS29W]|uniref:Uncharacterized protein n=1 Tax=Ideonella lacteola TaxID=2984193 RepID=A0ABU9BP76_9BURK
MMIFRLLFGLLLLAGILCLATYVATRDPVWRRRGLVIVKWTILAGLGALAVVVLERLALLL